MKNFLDDKLNFYATEAKQLVYDYYNLEKNEKAYSFIKEQKAHIQEELDKIDTMFLLYLYKRSNELGICPTQITDEDCDIIDKYNYLFIGLLKFYDSYCSTIYNEAIFD